MITREMSSRRAERPVSCDKKLRQNSIFQESHSILRVQSRMPRLLRAGDDLTRRDGQPSGQKQRGS